MDVFLLTPKELAVELKLREIDTADEQAMQKLERCLEDEEREPGKRPAKTHDPKSPKPELDSCAKALTELQQLAEHLKGNYSHVGVRALKARLWHWRGRVARLSVSSEKYGPEAEQLLPTYDGLMTLAATQLSSGVEAEHNSGQDDTEAAVDNSPGQDKNPKEALNTAPTRPYPAPSVGYHDFFNTPRVIRRNIGANQHGVALSPSSAQPNASYMLPNDSAAGLTASSYRAPWQIPIPKWKITFSGTGDGLDVSDFIFRLESLACTDQYPMERLTGVLSNFLTGTAENWYWVQLKKFPSITWAQLKLSLLERFGSYTTERETRRAIESRKQGPKESFNSFVLEIERLNGRLRRPFGEGELLEIIRDNMDPALQSATLTSSVRSTEELRQVCQRLEKLWNKSGHDPRHLNVSRHSKSCNVLESDWESRENDGELQVAALRARGEGLNQRGFDICWNCRELGHRYQDCSQKHLGIFCYGCGQPGVLKPNCPSCINRSGNRSSNVVRPGTGRSSATMTTPRTTTEEAASNTEPPTHR